MIETNKFNDLIDFTLNFYGLEAKYKVFFLDTGEYAECQIGVRLYMALGKFFMIENFKFLHYFYRDYPSFCNKHVKLLKEFKIDDDVEYGRILNVSEIVRTRASCIKLDDLQDLSSPMPFGVINDEYPLFFEIKKLKKDIDFIIIINENQFLVLDDNNQKLVVIHEAYHIVEHLKGGISHHHHETESIIKKILNEYHEYIRT